MTGHEQAHGADIEILEVVSSEQQRRSVDDLGVIVPNEVRINGSPVLTSSTHPVVVHETSLGDRGAVYVTLTLLARRVIVEGREGEAKSPPPGS